MPLPYDEPEILDGSRAWEENQAAFTSTPDPTRLARDFTACWYDASLSPYEGAFCLVQEQYEDLIGDMLVVTHTQSQTKIFVYVVGASSELPVDIGFTRQAWMRMTRLDLSEIPVQVQPAVPV